MPDEHQKRPVARIRQDSYEVDLRLRDLGLSRAPLIEAARQGDLQRRLNNLPDDFPAAAQFTRWNRTLREVRLIDGWHAGEFLRIPVAYNESETMAVAVSDTQDKRTGMPGDDPATNAKGPQTKAAVAQSASEVQGEFELNDHEPVDLWYLLTYTSDEGELRIELSEAAATGTQNRIDSWYERILIGRIDLETGGLKLSTSPPPSGITIDVHRKTA